MNWTAIIKDISVWSTNFTWIKVPGQNLTWNKIETYTACQNLDFTEYFDLKTFTPLQIFIQANKMDNMAISIYIEQRNKESRNSLTLCW